MSIGPGNELKKLLARHGLIATGACLCDDHAREMDEQGPAWCRENLATIVGRLRGEYERRRADYAAAMDAWTADATKPKPWPLPWMLRRRWSDRRAGWLVLIAIARAGRASPR
jgi:hypothetical protein